jgi:cytochrome P450 family 619
VLLRLVYGIRSPTFDAPYLKRLSDLVEIWARINEFGATPPVDIFPFLKYVPERFLGNWVTRAKHVHDELHDLYYTLVRSVKKRRDAIGSSPTIIDRLFDQQEKTGFTDHQIALLAGVTIKGGSDTSASVLTSFVQAMVAYQEVQKKAQAEIDAVVPEDRVPNFDDYEKLPYVAQIVKESHRWRPVAPLSVPHRTSEGKSHVFLRTTMLIVSRRVGRWQADSQGYRHLPQRVGLAP